MQLQFDGLLVTKERTIRGRKRQVIVCLTEKQAKARALKIWKAAGKWSNGDPEFFLETDMQLRLLNPKKPSMHLVILSDVFGIPADTTLGRVKLSEGDFI